MIQPHSGRLLYMAGHDPCCSAGEPAGPASGRTLAVPASYAGAAAVLTTVGPRPGKGDVVVVVLRPPGRVDLALVDALARFALSVRRCGGDLRVCAEADELRRLTALTGLAEMLQMRTCSGQARGEAEAIEQLSAEEVVDVPDLSA